MNDLVVHSEEQKQNSKRRKIFLDKLQPVSFLIQFSFLVPLCVKTSHHYTANILAVLTTVDVCVTFPVAV